MCGIAAQCGPHPTPAAAQVLGLQQHRGPDATGQYRGEKIWLGHNRLSIIDLSAAGNQPMQSHCGRYQLVFNGEIYNYKELASRFLPRHQWQSGSDSEVLLELYVLLGQDMLQHLTGMFAGIIWDEVEQTLWAFRDRFGVKPLYYALQAGHLYLASEIKTLWQMGCNKQPDEEVWAAYFTRASYGMPHQTFWLGIESLPAGHFLHWHPSASMPTTKRWYHFEERCQRISHEFESANHLKEAYETLLQEAVKLRFVSDVKVGLAVSGGLDSALLLATVHRLFDEEAKFDAFTFYTGHEAYDELPWVKQLTNATGVNFVPVLLSAQEVPALAEKMSRQQDEPFGGLPTLAYGKLFAHSRQQGTWVLLDGQGMDEAWAGYDYYWNSSDLLIQGSGSSPVFASAWEADQTVHRPSTAYPQPFADKLRNLQFRDLFYTKLPRALRFNDRASMMSSVELREPFLDHHLVEFAFALDAAHKWQDGLTKYTLRQIAARWMPQSVALAPKRALQTPQREWLRHDLRDWVEAQLSWLKGRGNPGWFNSNEIDKGWRQFVEGKTDNSFYVWQWINTALLLRG
jgi:asparagine synthase (glutamine-hydrolysing)